MNGDAVIAILNETDKRLNEVGGVNDKLRECNQSILAACDEFLIDYYNKYGMLPSQNPDIKLFE